MRIKALCQRILKQLKHDKRTIGLVVVAPILILSIMYFILDDDNSVFKVGIIDAPTTLVEKLKANDDVNLEISHIDSKQAEKEIKAEKLLVVLSVDQDYQDIKIIIDGSNSMNANKVIGAIKSSTLEAFQNQKEKDLNKVKADMEGLKDRLESLPLPTNQKIEINTNDLNAKTPEFKTTYVYGDEKLSAFDNYGAQLIGIIVFFFVYLIGGINFLNERISGTLDRLLATPIKRYEVVSGYVLGYTILAIVQTIVMTLFVVYGLGVKQDGNILYVFLINFLTAITALTLGILISSLARNEFQFIQFIPIIIIPQIFLCGIFNLSGVFATISNFIPIHYTAHGLSEVMLKGNGFNAIYFDCLVLLGCSIFFIIFNILALKKTRSI